MAEAAPTQHQQRMTLMELQRAQEAHDRVHHQDIHTLSRADRLWHLMAHLAKYAGRVAKVCDDLDHCVSVDVNGVVRKTVADLAIMTLFLANLFDLDLEPLIRDRWAKIEQRKVV